MKKLFTVLTLGVMFASCTGNKNNEAGSSQQSDTVLKAEQTAVEPAAIDSVDWQKIPESKQPDKFPFITTPKGFKVADAKEGLSEFFEFEKMENYLGSKVYSTEGKLGVMIFEAEDEKDFGQHTFDSQIKDELKRLGATEVYNGPYPANETANEPVRLKLKENQWTGKKRTVGLSDDGPFSVYAFRSDGKKYIIQLQSNSAQGQIFIMELK